jgi:hypothetical protein
MPISRLAASAHMVATDLLCRIRELLQDQPAPDGEVVITWAHFGSLAEVNQRLASVVAFLEGRER